MQTQPTKPASMTNTAQTGRARDVSHLGECLSAAHLLPVGDEAQQVGLGMANLITQALGGGEPSQHAAAHDGILLTQAATAVDGANAPHLQAPTSRL